MERLDCFITPQNAKWSSLIIIYGRNINICSAPPLNARTRHASPHITKPYPPYHYPYPHIPQHHLYSHLQQHLQRHYIPTLPTPMKLGPILRFKNTHNHPYSYPYPHFHQHLTPPTPIPTLPYPTPTPIEILPKWTRAETTPLLRPKRPMPKRPGFTTTPVLLLIVAFGNFRHSTRKEYHHNETYPHIMKLPQYINCCTTYYKEVAAYYELRTKCNNEITTNIYKRTKYNDRISAYNNRISAHNETAACSNTTASCNKNICI